MQSQYQQPRGTGSGSGGDGNKKGFIISLVVFVLGNGFAIASIVIGSIYKQGCPLEPMVPKYLIGE